MYVVGGAAVNYVLGNHYEKLLVILNAVKSEVGAFDSKNEEAVNWCNRAASHVIGSLGNASN